MEVVNMRDKVLEKEQTFMKKQESILLQETIQNHPSPQPPPPPTATTSPPSASASPTHEFSFTISLHPHPPSKSKQDAHNKSATDYDDDDTSTNQKHRSGTTTTPSRGEAPLTAIDLSPADDIFFHGHLLPLHLLSHLPISPRSSTNSMDSFTLPTKDILKDSHNPIGNTSFHYHHRNTFSDFNNMANNNNNNPIRPKSKSFSFFGRPKAKKDDKSEAGDHELHQDKDQRNNNNFNSTSKKKLKLEVAQLIKRYMKMVRPLLSFPKGKQKPMSSAGFNAQPHSFSGILPSSRRSSLPVMRRGEFSAPASMRTSPANSGILMASGTVSPAKSTTSDSTMEELQAAIQAAIAHCKNSIATEDKNNIQA